MAASERKRGTGGRADDRKQTPEEIAEERIEAVRKSKATELDLSALGLTQLPDSIGQLTQLKRLFVYGNKLTALPEVISQLTQLQYLIVSGNQLTALPEVISQLTQLKRLMVSDNELTALPEVIGQLTQLQHLIVSNNALTALPDTIGELLELRELSVAVNELSQLPEGLFRLRSLRSLCVSSNRLKKLPEALGDLIELRFLALDGNPLLELPTSMGKLRKLTGLALMAQGVFVEWGENHAHWRIRKPSHVMGRLRSLPDSIRGLTSLRQFLLHGQCGLGLPPEVLGPTWDQVSDGKAKPANPASILDYYFKMRGGRRPLNEVAVAVGGPGRGGQDIHCPALDRKQVPPAREGNQGD